MAVNLNMLKKEVKSFQADVDQEIKINHTVNEEQLMTFEDDYLQLEKENHKFQGAFITIKQYRELTIENESVINFYDENKNLVNRIRSSKGKDANSIVVNHDAKLQVYKLTTKLADRSEVIMKAPHSIVQKYWDEQYQKLSAFITQQLDNMKSNAPEEINGLSQNLFVQSEYSEIVKQNFTEVEKNLENLKLQLEKLQYAYTHI